MPTMRNLNRIVIGTCMIVMCLSVGLGVVSRYFVGRPLLWTDEIARLALVWLTFVGGAQLFSYQHGHLSLTFLTDRLSARAQRYLGCATNVIELVLMLVVTAGSLVFINLNAEAVTSALELPVYLVYGLIPLTSLVSVFFIGRKILAYAGGKSPDLAAAPSERETA
jgi:TRAP-type C4-dicarboxylate transport system permease small subunit